MYGTRSVFSRLHPVVLVAILLTGLAACGGSETPTRPSARPSFTLRQAAPASNVAVGRERVRFVGVFDVVLGDQPFGEIATVVYGTAGGSGPCDSPVRIDPIADLPVTRVDGPTGSATVEVTVTHTVDLKRLGPTADSACVLYSPRTPAGATRSWLVVHPLE